MAGSCRVILGKLASIAILLFQGSLFNAYLSTYEGKVWWCWFIADVCVIAVWLWCIYLAQHNFIARTEAGKNPVERDEIKYSFIAWFVYALFASPRVVMLVRDHAAGLSEEDTLGPNFLKVAVACTPLIFLSLVHAFHNDRTKSLRKVYVSSLVASVSLDLFDSTDMLEFLFDATGVFPAVFTTPILVLAVINFFIPCLALAEMRVNKFDGRVTRFATRVKWCSFKLVYLLTYVVVVNVPNLVIRSILWHKYNANVSVLIMKNVLCIVIGLNEIVEWYNESRAKQCPMCKNSFTRTHLNDHTLQCRKSTHEFSKNERKTDFYV